MKEKRILGKKICSRIGLRGDEILWLKHSLKKFFLKKNSRGEFPTKKSSQRHSPFLTYARYHFTDFRIHIIITQLLLPLRLEGEETLK